MGKDKRQIQIERAAGNFLCEQPEGSLFGAYLRLVEELEKGNGKDLAADHVTVWEKLEDTMSVEDMVEAIENAVNEPEIPEFLTKMDWKLLRKQKLTLLSIITLAQTVLDNHSSEEIIKPSEELVDDLDGILHMIDSIQDYAVDDLGIDEAEWDDLEIEERN